MDTKEFEAALKAVADKLQQELGAVRSNRPSVGMIEDVKVEAYGQTMAVNQLGSISVRPPREILVNLWDASVINTVAKAIETAKMGFSVAVDGTTIRVNLPPLTDERRAELGKMVKKMTEEIRISVRNHRDDAVKRLRAAQDAKQITEDQAFKTKEQLQKITEDTNRRIEAMLESKLKEIAE